ncbi:SDR family oxidoreductase [Asticcacaulis sp.]|uniref:SDR family oxidoreductase n=1 Tax=Asticcacaulis sp. TaxID=1872648 RepID=UPI002C461A3A|nr:SDR family oxidoreductase [Asticcacaulis sp.]HTM81533.1 SDR family oxidoreductase [Asticcacaulis sp.]
MTSLKLHGRNVLLTGALGSLGRAQATHFLEAGAQLYLLDRPNHPDAETFVAELQKSAAGRAAYIGLDLEDVENAAQEIAELAIEIGGFDILVNNAALIVNKPFETFKVAEYEAQMRVNAGAPFALSQAVAPAMKANKRGVIINFCSVTLNGEWNGYVPYVASKGAMLGLTKSLARELGPFGVRVNAIAPGAVTSEAEARVFGDRAEDYETWVLTRQSLKTRIIPDDIARAVLFLVSDDANMISGHVLDVDGGW